MNKLKKQRSPGLYSKEPKSESSKRIVPKPADVDLQLNGKFISLSQRPAGLSGRVSARSALSSGSTRERPMSAIPSLNHHKTNLGSVNGWKRPQSADHSLPNKMYESKVPLASIKDRNYYFPQLNSDWNDMDRANLFSLQKPLSLSSLTDESDHSHHVTTPRLKPSDRILNASLRLNLTGHKSDGDNYSDFGATYTLPDMLERTWTEEELIRYCDEADNFDSDDNFQSEASMGEKILEMAQRSAPQAIVSDQKPTHSARQRTDDAELNGSTESLRGSRLELAERETDLLLKQLVEREQGPRIQLNQAEDNSRNLDSKRSLSNKQLYDELNMRRYTSTEPYMGNQSYRGEIVSAGSFLEGTMLRSSLESNYSNLGEMQLKSNEYYVCKDKYARGSDSKKTNSEASSPSSRSPRETMSLSWDIPVDKWPAPAHRNTRKFSARSRSVERNIARKYEPPITSRSLSFELGRKSDSYNSHIYKAKDCIDSDSSLYSQLSSNLRDEGPMSSGCSQNMLSSKVSREGLEEELINQAVDEDRLSRIILLNRRASESIERSKMLADKFSNKESSMVANKQASDEEIEDHTVGLATINWEVTQQSTNTTEHKDVEENNVISGNLPTSPCSKMLMLIDFDEQLVEPAPPSSQKNLTYEEIIDVSLHPEDIHIKKETQYKNTIDLFLKETGQETDRSNGSISLKLESRNTNNDISDILKVLEQEEAAQYSARLTDSITDLNFANQFSDMSCYQREYAGKPPSPENPGNLVELLSYLDRVDGSSQAVLDLAKNSIKSVQENTARQLGHAEPFDRGDGQAELAVNLEDLLSLSVVDLAHMVFTLRFQMTDKAKSVRALKQALKEEREQRQKIEYEAEKNLKSRLQEQKDHFENAVARHQKFIDQLISDKKALTSKVENVVDEMKALEERHTKNLKVIQDRHAIEIKRAKDCQAASNKMKMDSWISTKTKKIKEQTVKGLEPELVRMTAAHQQELSELRHLHQHELKEAELRGARKTDTALELLRTQMALEKEAAIARERELAKTRLEKQAEQEEVAYQEQRQRLLSEVQREKQRFDQELRAAAADGARAAERLAQEHRDAAEAAARAHAAEMRKMREALNAEREQWASELRRQKELELAEREQQCREESRIERDKQIEMVITRLTEETSQAKSELEISANTKMRKLKEKFAADVKELEDAEHAAKTKYIKVKEQLADAEDAVSELKVCNRQLEKELYEEKKLSAAFSTERAQLKESLREEVATQLASAERDTQRLRAEVESGRARHDVELRTLRDVQQHELRAVHDRVKVVVAQRDATVEQLRNRCTQLEALVEAQRKEYLLK